MSKLKKANPIIVSTGLTPEGQQRLDATCDQRGMTIESLLGRLIDWLAQLDRTEQSIVLGQVEESDMPDMLDLARCRRRN